MSTPPAVEGPTDTSTARPAPLPRQRFAGSEDPPPRTSPYSRADADSSRASSLRALASTTAGKLALVLIAGWTIFGALQLTGNDHARDREIADQLQQYGDAIGQLRHDQAPADEWSTLRERIDSELPQLVEELERRASSKRPVTQDLLRAARDCLPRMLQPSPEPTWYEERFHEYLAEVEQQLDAE